MDRSYRLEKLRDNPSWEYDPKVRVLRYRANGYEVDPERPCSGPISPGQVLGCIAHVAAKTWATPEVVGHLVAALEAVLDLQNLGFSGHAVSHLEPDRAGRLIRAVRAHTGVLRRSRPPHGGACPPSTATGAAQGRFLGRCASRGRFMTRFPAGRKPGARQPCPLLHTRPRNLGEGWGRTRRTSALSSARPTSCHKLGCCRQNLGAGHRTVEPS